MLSAAHKRIKLLYKKVYSIYEIQSKAPREPAMSKDYEFACWNKIKLSAMFKPLFCWKKNFFVWKIFWNRKKRWWIIYCVKQLRELPLSTFSWVFFSSFRVFAVFHNFYLFFIVGGEVNFHDSSSKFEDVYKFLQIILNKTKILCCILYTERKTLK